MIETKKREIEKNKTRREIHRKRKAKEREKVNERGIFIKRMERERDTHRGESK